MRITIHDLMNRIFDSGVMRTSAAEELLKNTLSQFVAHSIDMASIVQSLLSQSAWSAEDQERIASVLKTHEGSIIYASDADSPQVGDQEDPHTPSLDTILTSIKDRKKAIYLTPNADRSWSASISALPDYSNSALLTTEKTYPATLYYSRTDLNGSSVMEREICQSRVELLQTLNWLGKCGYLPMELWDFDAESVLDRQLTNILLDNQKRRMELIEKDQDIIAAACDCTCPKSFEPER